MTYNRYHHRQTQGIAAEKQARAYLEKLGMAMLVKNFRSPFGEIDLIMQDKDDIVFVEVRSRCRTDYGTAADSINRQKQQRLVRTAKFFLQTKKLLFKVHSRFDVVAIHHLAGKTELQWIKNAFYAGC